MAGTLRLAAKILLGSAVLAGTGVGVYYGTRVEWPILLGLDASDFAQENSAPASDETSTSLQAHELDAVASAWAEPAKSTTEDKPESSKKARDADVVLAEAEVAAEADRYAALATAGSAANADAEVEPTAEKLSDTPALAAIAPEKTSEVATEPANELAVDELVPTPDLARGQEPKEEPFVEDLQEPAPLPADNHVEVLDAAQQQAAPSKSPQQSTSGTNSDRYGADPSAASQPAIVNPFSAKPPSGNPIRNQQAAIEPLQPLEGQNAEIGGQLSELQEKGTPAPQQFDRNARAQRNTQSGDMFAAPATARPTNESLNNERMQPLESPRTLANNGLAETPAGEGTGKPGERALEGAQRPALEIQKFAPTEIQVGKPAKFVVQIRNVGTQAAEGVTIHDEVPQGTRLISTNPTAENNGPHLSWDLGKLSPGEDRTVELQLMPTTEGELGSVATVTYSAQASAKTRCTMPQLAIRMTAPNKVMLGQEARVKIELKNPGSGDATGVMLFENVPQNVRHAAGPALEFEIGTLKAGESRELELVLVAEKAGKTVNVLSAKADGNLQVQQQVEFDVIAPELNVDVNGPERRYLERPATYEVNVQNPGTAPARDVQIITKLPKGLQFVRANNMGEYDANSHAVYWSLAELPEGEDASVELVAMPIETGQQTLEVESRAGDGLADQTKRDIVIDGMAAIMFELHDMEDPIEKGGETGYEIRVANQGTKAATNVQVAVLLPPAMQLVSAEGETQHTAQNGRILFDPIAELAPKADTVYRIRVQGMQAGDQRVTVEVNTDDIAQPIRREESTHIFGDD